MLLRINRVRINRYFYTWNDRIPAKISKKLWIKWNFELTVFELTVPDLYKLLNMCITARKRSLGQGNIFSSVCQEGGVCLSVCWDTTPPPPADRRPRSRHPPGADTLPAQWRLGDTINKRAVCILLECNLVSNNIEFYWGPVRRGKIIHCCAIKFEAGEKNRMTYESFVQMW